MTIKFFTILTSFLTAFTVYSQTVKTYIVDVGLFNELLVQNSIPVDYIESKDSVGIATFESIDSTAHSLAFINKKGKLTITLEPRTYGRDHIIPRITVRSNSLVSATNYGDSLVRITKPSTSLKFQAKIVGNGTLTVTGIESKEVKGIISFGSGRLSLQGICEKAQLDNTGQGVIQAGGLKSHSAICYLMGTGNIDCYATEEVSIKGMGSGTVYYGGNPKEVRNRGLHIKAENCENCD